MIGMGKEIAKRGEGSGERGFVRGVGVEPKRLK